jgi:hypothetical protein
MSDELRRLIELAKEAQPTAEESEMQRRSFAYGNTHFENESITRETVDRAAEMLAEGSHEPTD